jgi:hypothetical protein
MKTQYSLPKLRHEALALALIGAALLCGCSINVKKDKNGEDKNVDIDTPVARLHVSQNADAHETGLPVYPGAQLIPEGSNGSDKSANVNISTSFFGLKVVALQYRSDDPPDKVIAYYENQLKKYGNVLVCHSPSHEDVSMQSGDSKNSKELTCEHTSGPNTELKAGTRDNQRIVSVEARGKGSKFALVLVQTHGDQSI